MSQPTVSFLTTSVQQRNAILAALFQLGWKWHGNDECTTPKAVEEQYSQQNYPVITRHAYIAGNTSLGCDNYCTLEELLVPKAPDSVKVKLSYDYCAEIKPGSDNIDVGCQTFPIAAIREVVAQWEKLNPKSNP